MHFFVSCRPSWRQRPIWSRRPWWRSLWRQKSWWPRLQLETGIRKQRCVGLGVNVDVLVSVARLDAVQAVDANNTARTVAAPLLNKHQFFLCFCCCNFLFIFLVFFFCCFFKNSECKEPKSKHNNILFIIISIFGLFHVGT